MGCGNTKEMASQMVESQIQRELDAAVAAYQGPAEQQTDVATKVKEMDGPATEMEASDAVLKLLSNRPERHGKWFTIHESLLPEIEYEAVCDIYAEFLQHHPNGGEKTAGFKSVRLNEEQIKEFAHLLRISSYRWKDFKGLGPKGDQFVLPGNYLWFLNYVRERKLILWMEYAPLCGSSTRLAHSRLLLTRSRLRSWMANVGVNVPVPEVIGYMGSLYAENIVLGEWISIDLDMVGVALSRAWIFQEMAFGRLDKKAMSGLFERLRELGRAVSEIPYAGKQPGNQGDLRRMEPEDEGAVKAYTLACGCVALLLSRRAFGVIAADVEWLQAMKKMHPGTSLEALGIDVQQASDICVEASAELPGVDEDTWGRLLLLCSAQQGRTWYGCFDWTDKLWEANCQELLELVCAPPYTSCDSLDELVQRYARGLLGASLGCEVTFESDRPEAITAVLRAIALTKFGVELSVAELMEQAWQSLFAEMVAARYGAATTFGAPKVHALVVAGSSSFALAPLQLYGTLATYEQEKNDFGAWVLTCHYSTADGSVATFKDWPCVVVSSAVRDAELRGIARSDKLMGLPEEPLPKLQDAAGAQANLCLCVPMAEPSATTAKGFAFVLLTQPREQGNRVISLRVVSKTGTRPPDPREECKPDMEGKPPRSDIRFFESVQVL